MEMDRIDTAQQYCLSWLNGERNLYQIAFQTRI